jgi:hypothetical protein
MNTESNDKKNSISDDAVCYNFTVSCIDGKEVNVSLTAIEGAYFIATENYPPRQVSKFVFDLVCNMAPKFESSQNGACFFIPGWFNLNDFLSYFFESTNAMSLGHHIRKHYDIDRGAFTKFGFAQGVKRQQVNEWLDKDMIVADGKLYSFRRQLNIPNKR